MCDGSLLWQLHRLNDPRTGTISTICHDVRDFPRQAPTPEFRKRAFSPLSYILVSLELITFLLTSSLFVSTNHREQGNGRPALHLTT